MEVTWGPKLRPRGKLWLPKSIDVGLLHDPDLNLYFVKPLKFGTLFVTAARIILCSMGSNRK